MLRFLAFALLTIFLQACATDIKVNLPYAHVATPDTTGKKGISVAAGLLPTKEVELAQNTQSRPPVFGTVEKSNIGDIYGKLEYGIMERLDLGASYGGESGMFAGLAKFQIFGSGREQNESGFLLGIFGRFGNGSDSENGDQQVTFGPGGFPWRAKGTVKLAEGGMSFGYRTGDLMFFLGGAYGDLKGELTIDHDQSTDLTSPAAHYESDFEGRTVSASIGLRAHNKLTVSAVASELHWTGIPRVQEIQGWVEYGF